MTVFTKRRPVTSERDHKPPLLVHRYPKDPRYRLSGNWDAPQPGDIARCGWVKRTPHHAPQEYIVSCVVCAHLAGGA